MASLEGYFQGTAAQLRDRASVLLNNIPRNLPREFHLLIQLCQHAIREALSELAWLSDAPMQAPNVQSERLRHLRRIVRDLDNLENVAIAALNRADPKQDRWLNLLMEQIRADIAFPLLPPVVTSLSGEYFHTFPAYNLVRVPLVEGNFLLHLPDLYHEVSHLLFAQHDDPKIAPFLSAVTRTLDRVLGHFTDTISLEKRRNGPELLRYHMKHWQESWSRPWLIEFFCDAFALYTVGPAFAWSHFHLVAKRGQDPFEVDPGYRYTHPADGARMEVLLKGLRLSGFSREAGEIRRQWEQLIAANGSRKDPDYVACYPDSLLAVVAREALQGVEGMGCVVVRPGNEGKVSSVLNQAWDEFWLNPMAYSEWEHEAQRRLRESLGA